MGLMTNFLSLKEMFRISLQGKPIFGDSLRWQLKQYSIHSLWIFQIWRALNVSLAVPADGAVVKLIICTVTEEAESHARSTEKVKAFMWQHFWLKWNKLNMFPL